MIQLKTLYNKITVREKMLLVLFLWVLVFLWLSMFGSKMADLFREFETVNASLAYQQVWLNSEASIEERLAESREILDPNKTYAKGRFIGRLDALAQASGASYDVTNPTTRLGDVFNEHSLTVQFKEASMKALMSFDQAIQKEHPYLGVKEVKITPNRSDPKLLNAQFDVIALELKIIENLQGAEKPSP